MANRKAPADGGFDDGEPLLIDVKEVARLLSLGVRTVWRLSGGGTLPKPISIGRAKRWERRAIVEFIRSRNDRNLRG